MSMTAVQLISSVDVCILRWVYMYIVFYLCCHLCSSTSCCSVWMLMQLFVVADIDWSVDALLIVLCVVFFSLFVSYMLLSVTCSEPSHYYSTPVEERTIAISLSVCVSASTDINKARSVKAKASKPRPKTCKAKATDPRPRLRMRKLIFPVNAWVNLVFQFRVILSKPGLLWQLLGNWNVEIQCTFTIF